MKRSFLREVDCLRGVGVIHRAGACGGPRLAAGGEGSLMCGKR